MGLQITIEPTEVAYVLGGSVPVRVWNGVTGQGNKVKLLVAATLASPQDKAAITELAQSLLVMKPLTSENGAVVLFPPETPPPEQEASDDYDPDLDEWDQTEDNS